MERHKRQNAFDICSYKTKKNRSIFNNNKYNLVSNPITRVKIKLLVETT